MRLLHIEDDGGLRLAELIEDDIPEYAILSHTWGADGEEVSYRDMMDGTGQEKRGFRKIRFCAQQAQKNGLRHFWVDTCCIDKSSSAELAESINSMFRYYRDAIVCYAFLEDFPQDMAPKDGLSQCRWFSRGWTLQELLAPKRVEFYSSEWKVLGSKRDHARDISSFTNIPKSVLFHAQTDSIAEQSVSARMSWACNRRTKRTEDIAYCLLGIFDVNMPLIYGEGAKAFRRLQEEIIKRDNDLSIFAWNSISECQYGNLVGVFAKSPAAFANVPNTGVYRHQVAEFSVTNRGLLLTGDFEIYGWYAGEGTGPRHYVLKVGQSMSDQSSIGIFLRKCGPGFFRRVGGLPLASSLYEPNVLQTRELMHTVYISTDAVLTQLPAHVGSFRQDAIQFPKQQHLQMQSVVPFFLWDHFDSIFLNPKPWSENKSSMVLAAEFSLTIDGYVESTNIVVMCPGHGDPSPRVFITQDYLREKTFLFEGKASKNGISWEDLVEQAPRLLLPNRSIFVKRGSRTFNISVGVQDVQLDIERGKICVRSLTSSAKGIEPSLRKCRSTELPLQLHKAASSSSNTLNGSQDGNKGKYQRLWQNLIAHANSSRPIMVPRRVDSDETRWESDEDLSKAKEI